MEKENKIILSLKEFQKNYKNMSLDILILFVVDFLGKKEIEPRFDHIVMTAFKLFPKKFSLLLYPEYPDAIRVSNSLTHCTYEKKWLDGNIKSGFKISDKGEFILNDFNMTLSKIKNEESTDIDIFEKAPKRKEKTIIDKVLKTKAYSYFLQGKLNELNPDYLKEALRCTPDTNKKELKDNYLKIYKYALEIKVGEKFLDFLNKIIQILEI